MSANVLFASAHSSHEQEIRECRAHLLDHTLHALRHAGMATEQDLVKVQHRYQSIGIDEDPIDPLEILARMQGATDEYLPQELAKLAHGISAVIPACPPLIPFAGKLIAPSAFYEAYTQLHSIARALLSPVIFAEDTDAIGTGALNPIASQIMADQILGAVNRRFGIRPFVTAVRLDFDSWTFLNRKHFGL
ncbi:MAG: hypothetical protein MUF31_13140 [Akkermansiaceae bacterium]|jgi:hypothetical protein|nr:hypothetical protein [Akkermansiaceae bacterium]